MKSLLPITATLLLLLLSPCQAGFLDDLSRTLLPPTQQGGSSLDNITMVKGLKEALAIVTARSGCNRPPTCLASLVISSRWMSWC